MWAYILKRLLLMIPTLFGIVLITLNRAGISASAAYIDLVDL